MTPVTQSLFQLNIAVILLGGTTLFAKLISLPAQTITLYRAIIGFLALALYIGLSRTDFRLKNGTEYLSMATALCLLFSFCRSFRTGTLLRAVSWWWARRFMKRSVFV